MINDELESELDQLRQALSSSIAAEIQIKQQIQKNSDLLEGWKKHAAKARELAKEDLACQADEQIKQCKQRSNELETQLFSQQDFTANLKKNLAKLESQRFSTGADGTEALAATETTLSTIQRMENKIVTHESMAELSADKVARKFAADKAKDDLEEELKALKAAKKKE